VEPRFLKALIAHSDPIELAAISRLVEQSGFQPVHARTVSEIRSVLAKQKLSLIFCDSDLPDGTFRDVLQAAQRGSRVPVVVGSRTGGWEEYCKALHHGAFDLVPTPCGAEEMRRILNQVPRSLPGK